MRRVLSFKRLAILLGVAAVLAAGAVAVHAVQVRRQADVLRVQAERAEEAGRTDPEKLAEAADLYKRYLKYRRTDEPTYARYAALMTARAKADPALTEEAANALEGYLRQFPDHRDDRRALVDFCIKLNRLASARQHLSFLVTQRGTTNVGAPTDDPDDLDKAATCELGLGGDFEVAVELLDNAVRGGKARPEVAGRLIGMLNSNTKFDKAKYTTEEYVRVLIDKEPYRSDPVARMVAARFMLLKGKLAEARDNIDEALTKLPGGSVCPDVRIAAAELEKLEIKGPETIQPQLRKAEQHLRTAAAAAPQNVAVGLLLSEVLVDLGHRGEAIDVLRRAAENVKGVTDQTLLVVDRLLDLEELVESNRLTEEMAMNPADRDRVVKYFNGRRAVIKEDWATARTLLEEVAPALARVPMFHKKAMVGIGRSYAVLQNPDKMLACFADALRDDPYYLPAIVGQAEALTRLGKKRDALPQYRTMVVGYKLEPFRGRYAELELDAVRSQLEPLRKWEAFEAALGPVQARTPELHVLNAESLFIRKDFGKAADALDAALRADRKYVPAWVALARVRGAGDPAAYAATLNEAVAAAGDSVEIRLARSLGLFLRGKLPGPDELRAVAAGTDAYPAADQNRLWRGLGEAAVAAAARSEADAPPLRAFAIECLQKAAELDRNDLVSRAVLIDLGQAANRPEVVQSALAGLAAVEGPDGPIGTLGRVVVRFPEVLSATDPAARQAGIRDLRALCEKAKTLRQTWGRVYIALGKLDDAEQAKDAAFQNYKTALDLGERDEFVVRRVVDLLREKRQDDEAAAELNRLQTKMTLPDDLERFRAVRDLLARDLPRSERPTIDRVAPAAATDWRVLLLRGQLLAAIGDEDDALRAFEGAVNYGPKSADAWAGLVFHQVRMGKASAARATIAEGEGVLARTPPDTPALKAELIDTLGSCHEAVGNLDAAEKKFREAVAVAPAELNPRRELVLFLQRTGKTAEAEALLTDMGRDPSGRWARRHLALSILTRDDAYHVRDRAVALIDQNLKIVPRDEEDERAHALILTIDPRTRADGMKRLTDDARWNKLNPDEYFHLGRLYFAQGKEKVFEAAEYFEKATRGRQGVNVEHLSALARVYLGTNNLPKARQAVGRLKSFAPRAWETAREEARLLKREAAAKKLEPEAAAKLTEQAKARVLEFAGATTDPAVVRLKTGPLLDELGFHAEAQGVFAWLLEQKGVENRHVPMTLFLIRRKQTADAIRLAREHQDGCPVPLTAQLLTGAVRAKSPGPGLEAEVAGWLDAKIRATANPFEQIALLGCKGELLDALTRYDEAISTYELALSRVRALPPADQGKVRTDVYLNNLAMLLALHRPGEVDRAIGMMNEVLAVRGPAPAYLDTRAVCLLVKGGRTAEAVDDLELALIQNRSPAYLFHLAWAYNLDTARRGLRDGPLVEARELGLTAEDLHPLEGRVFRELYAPR